MNPTTLTAWLICLVLAFFAAAVAMFNRYELMEVKEQIESAPRALPEPGGAEQQGLQDLHEELQKIDRQLLRLIQERETAGRPQAPAAEGKAEADEEESDR